MTVIWVTVFVTTAFATTVYGWANKSNKLLTNNSTLSSTSTSHRSSTDMSSALPRKVTTNNMVPTSNSTFFNPNRGGSSSEGTRPNQPSLRGCLLWTPTLTSHRIRSQLFLVSTVDCILHTVVNSTLDRSCSCYYFYFAFPTHLNIDSSLNVC